MAQVDKPTREEEQSELVVAEATATKPWQPYLEAALGFRNHWYPAFFSYELNDDECRGEKLLGEPVFFKRIDGVVYAVQDRCVHRGTAFSRRPECYTPNTISCWYHGFTYNLKDGNLVAIITDPDSALVGKVRLKTYPVEEHKGIVFVFIGDLDPPPPLCEDLQPGFLDENLAIVPRGDRQVVGSNWRLAVENGFDAAHIYIHRNSALITATHATLPLGVILYSREGMVVAEDGAPKGVVKGSGKRVPVWETEIEGVKIAARFRPGQEGVFPSNPDVSIWLPCGLAVDPSPAAGVIPGLMQFEWYVPVDERSHAYMVTWGKRVQSPTEAEAFYEAFDPFWADLVVNGFNNDDVAVREAGEQFYAEENGWYRERLYRPDLIITEWRKLASAHNRGIQRRADLARPGA
jgi:carbazole 1,9a-dioxygenase terminal dioxygenase component